MFNIIVLLYHIKKNNILLAKYKIINLEPLDSYTNIVIINMYYFRRL